MMYKVEVVLESRCNLGESPVYDPRLKALFFVDINSKRIHKFSLDDKHHVVYQLEEPVGMIALTDTPNVLLAATERSILKVSLSQEPGSYAQELLAVTPESHGVEQMRFNDGKVSPGGVLVVGRMHSKWRQGNQGKLYYLDSNATTLHDITPPQGVGLPNGLVWHGDAMYFVDSSAETITKYHTDSKGIPQYNHPGEIISNRPTGHAHVPDGMAMDADGNLWVALGESSSVICYDGQTGDVLRTVVLPVKRPTSCIFGGDDLSTLYVTTRVESGEGASMDHGAILAVTHKGVKGMHFEPYFPLHQA